MGKMPHPWPDWFVLWTSEATRRKIRSETQDVLVFGEYESARVVPGINLYRRARIMTSMSMRRRSGVPNVASGSAGSYVLVRPLLHEKQHERCSVFRRWQNVPSGKMGVGRKAH